MSPKQKIVILIALLVLSVGLFFMFKGGSASLIGRVAPLHDYKEVPVLSIVKNEDLLRPALKQLGVKGMMEKLVVESEGGSKFDCHQESHTIGRVAYELYKQIVFGECDPSCHSGCYHGAMEMFLNEKGTVNLAANIDSVCGLFKNSFVNFECLHGVGHGLLAYEDYDMPATIKECKNLKDSFSTDSCYGGMFMENVLTAQGLGAGQKSIHETKWANRTDPLFPCTGIDLDDYNLQYQCYQMQTSWMLTIFDYDFQKVSRECLKAPASMVSVCYKSFGRDAAGNSLRNSTKMKETCSLVPKQSDYYNQCVIGAVNVVIDFWGPSLKGQASDFCRILDGEGKNTCYHTLGSRLSHLFTSSSEQVAVCNTFELDYRKYCQI